MTLRRWKTTEERLLREHYWALGPQACAELLGRTPSAVWTRASKLGLAEKDPRAAQRFNVRTTPRIRPNGWTKFNEQKRQQARAA